MSFFDEQEKLPLTFKCGHTFCKTCTFILFNGNSKKIECPIDKRKSYNQRKDEIAKNYQLIGCLNLQKNLGKRKRVEF